MMTKLIVGNWKMYPTLSDSLVLAAGFKKSLEDIRGVEIVLAPPTAWLVPVIESWKHQLPHVHFAAQNIWPNDQGAYTGEVSAYMLKNIVQYAIVGHSERRALGETDEVVSKKLKAVLAEGLVPILCVGEKERDADGRYFDILKSQIKFSLAGLRRPGCRHWLTG